MSALMKDYRRYGQLLRLRNLLHVDTILAQAWRRLGIGPYLLRSHFDAVQRPPYAYGVLQAARLGKALDFNRISVCEFGVAAGAGLIELERAAREFGKAFDIDIAVYGFDSGEGLPQSQDHRDIAYWWHEGLFPMDHVKLKARLTRAELILGPVAETIPAFVESLDQAPLGFCAFDLDFYSSTKDALAVFAGDFATRLPRVVSYFDDLIGGDLMLMCRHVGQHCAIEEFNEERSDMKIAHIFGLTHKRLVRASWNDRMYACHDFAHPLYNQQIRQHFGPGDTCNL